MPTGRAPAPLTHEAFRQTQRSVELEGLSYKELRVAWTNFGDGEPVILLHGFPTWLFLYNEVIPKLAETGHFGTLRTSELSDRQVSATIGPIPSSETLFYHSEHWRAQCRQMHDGPVFLNPPVFRTS